ncbi:conjugal transfer protein TraG N-terminal domain-containing protein [Pasteurella oralis]|uniref:conjugal transfer protein TraG N-terminal domain-containing protein n=1 Tax=Pasteurella oralis TaxID=1071947 RepID=UPI000C7ABE81|nr:conjugal transfer protein TraG N-terminal domain-containing protein [Pasteurella oralis]
MNISLTVDSYYDYFLTLLSWIISNNIWELLTQTGIFAIPFIAHMISTFLKVREQGDDEGNKGRLYVNWLENKIYVSLLVLVFCCLPVFTVSYQTLTFPKHDDDIKAALACGRTTYIAPEKTALGTVSTELNGKSAQLPIWWAFTYSVGKGLTHGAIASLPCKPDLRQVRFEIQNTQIKNPVLRQEVEDFVAQCFVPARSKIKRQQIEIDEVQARDLDWIGSKLLVNTPGFYDNYRSQLPRSQWAYDSNRDAGLPNTGFGGYPSCQDWWVNPNVGLKARLLAQVEPETMTKVQAIFKNKGDYHDLVVRNLVRPANLQVSDGSVYNGYGRDPIANSGILSAPIEAMNATIGIITTSIGAILTGPMFDTIRQSLPMLQALINLVIVIVTPLIIIIGNYQIKTVITITVIQFGTFFLTFWWELARWLDSWTMTALYSSSTHSYWNMYGVLNTGDDIILNVINSLTFLILPGLWFGMLSWAGITGGKVAAGIVEQGTKGVEKTNKTRKI